MSKIDSLNISTGSFKQPPVGSLSAATPPKPNEPSVKEFPADQRARELAHLGFELGRHESFDPISIEKGQHVAMILSTIFVLQLFQRSD